MKNLNFFGKNRHYNFGFTLVEIMVAITIFMIIMVSVLQIFGISVNISNKVDINRQLQENIKNITETIAEDIRKNSIGGVKKEVTDSYTNNSLDSGVILKIGTGTIINKYYLSNDENTYSIIPYSDISKCSELQKNCFLVLNDGISTSRITNSWMAIEKLNFTILGNDIKRLIITFVARPANNKGVSPSLIKNSKFVFQTTLSERFIRTK